MVSMISEEGRTKVGIYEYVIDTATELSEVPTDVQVGSIVYCIEDSKKYMLDSSGSYVEVNFKKGGSGGEAKLGTKDIDENGSYKASDFNLDGWSQVNVNISGGYTLLASVEIDLSNVETSSTLLHTFENLPSAWDSSKILYLCARNKDGKVNDKWYGNDMFIINNQEAKGETSALSNLNKKGFIYKVNYNATSISINDGLTSGVYFNVTPNDVKIYGKMVSTTTGSLSGITAKIDLYALAWPDNISPFV